MASADRPNKVDQPTEPNDHPLSTPERIDRSDDAVISYRTDNWSKADPIKLLTPEQRDKAYPPTNNPDPTTAERDDVTIQTDRLGDRIVNDETDKRSLRQRGNEVLVRRSDEVKDIVEEQAGNAHAALGRVVPTGAYTEFRPDPVAVVDKTPHGQTDVSVIAAASVAGVVFASTCLDHLLTRLRRTREED